MKQNKTTVIKEKKAEWHFVDADNKVLGRLASDIAVKLAGKHKAGFSYRINTGDKVVVTNASKIKLTGKKLTDKEYKWHTGYPGNVKSITAQDLLEKKPEELILKAVKGMLPKNKLQKERLNNLYVYAGPEHPHKAQEK